MQNEKRLFLTILLCLGVMLVWQTLFAPKRPAPGPDKAPDGGRVEGPQEAGTTEGPAPLATRQQKEEPGKAEPADEGKAEAVAEAVARGPEVVVSYVNGDLFEVTFSSYGGRLKSITLFHPRYKEEVSRGGEKEVVPVDMVRHKQDELISGGFVLDGLPGGDALATAEYELVSPREGEEAKDEETGETLRRWTFRHESDGLVVERRIGIRPDRYLIDLDVSVENKRSKSFAAKPALLMYGRPDPESGGGGGCAGGAGLMAPAGNIIEGVCYVKGKNEKVSRKDLEVKGWAGPIGFAGINERYFVYAALPHKAEIAECHFSGMDDNVIQLKLGLPGTKYVPNKPLLHSFRLYTGPKELSRLNEAGGKLGESVDFGMFAFLCRPMLWLLKLLQKVAINWGLAIILLTIFIKLLTLPLTHKSFKSMQDMQKLKPLMDELKEKYGNDRQAMNQQMMQLYKDHKINPLGGCLPMLIQMPIWFALYRTIYSSVELYRAGFVGWITDLSAQDPYYVLPLLLGVTMFVQQSFTPTAGMDSGQAKMMKWMMPVMFTFLMLFLPSGLVLYIFASTLLGIAQHGYVRVMGRKQKLDAILNR